MSEQENKQMVSSLRPALSKRKPRHSPDQTNQQLTLPQRPTSDDYEEWRVYWQSQNQPWRTEPEIGVERQTYLAKRRSITPNKEQGISPFKDIKLSRADVEWLLATHEDGRGPVDWNDEQQRNRKGLDLAGAYVRNMNLSGLPLSRMNGFGWARMTDITDKQIDLLTIHLEGAKLSFTHLEGANLFKAYLEGVYAYGVHLEEALLSSICLQGACLNFAHLENAVLISANLEKASLKGAHLEGANIDYANLEGTILSEAFFDRATQLKNVVLNKEQDLGVSIVDIRWGDVNLAVMNWAQVQMLGDELDALQKKRDGQVKSRNTRLEEYEVAVRANRQLAVMLQSQGMNEVAAHFAYRGQVLQKSVLWFQMTQKGIKFRQRLRTLGGWLFYWFLFLLAGYGYKPWRSLLAYFVVILGFATSYFLIGQTVGPSLSPVGSVVFSMTSFHGRGFFPGGIALDDPLTILAAIEAFVGLLIEVTFIATLTQRLFGK